MKILITGGSGLVGSYLTSLLYEAGHEVVHTSRKRYDHPQARVFEWDLNRMTMEDGALDGVDAVVNLAGAGVADARWSEHRKRVILESRTKALQLLHQEISKLDQKPKTLVSASGVGFYGSVPFDQISKEDDEPGDTFLAEVCLQWEKEAFKLARLGMNVSALRIGIVLDRFHGALAKLAQPIKWFAGAPLGSGRQMMPWVHVHDLSRMFRFLIENPEHHGVYNAVGLDAKTNSGFTRAVAKVLKRSILLPNVPSLVMKMMLGEMAQIVLDGNAVSNQKILDAGFQFEYATLEEALQEIYSEN